MPQFDVDTNPTKILRDGESGTYHVFSEHVPAVLTPDVEYPEDTGIKLPRNARAIVRMSGPIYALSDEPADTGGFLSLTSLSDDGDITGVNVLTADKGSFGLVRSWVWTPSNSFPDVPVPENVEVALKADKDNTDPVYLDDDYPIYPGEAEMVSVDNLAGLELVLSAPAGNTLYAAFERDY